MSGVNGIYSSDFIQRVKVRECLEQYFETVADRRPPRTAEGRATQEQLPNVGVEPPGMGSRRVSQYCCRCERGLSKCHSGLVDVSTLHAFLRRYNYSLNC